MKKIKLLLIGILLCTSFTMFAQQTVKGVVKEKTTGSGLPGVSIVVKGTTKGTSTDFDGNFQLTNVKTGDVLVFSFIGYQKKEITLGSNFILSIELDEASQKLDDIVIIGYGTTTVKDATGSVESITAKDFTKGNIVTPENLLSGRVAGVSITTSGAPGSGSAIRIRGGSSINASNDPLIVIDGLPIDNNGTNGSRGILANINPNDIESFSVLKDASSTAIYGSRASNGVIIITTKKGRSEYSLNYDVQYSLGSVNDRINVYSADQFRTLVNSQPINGVTLDTSLLGNANTNWQDEVLRNTLSSQHNLTVRGSLFDRIPTRLTVNFTEIEGSLLTSQFNRRNASLAMNPTFFNDHLKVNFNYNRAFEISRFGDSGQLGAALRYDPTQPVYDSSSPFGGFYQHLVNGEPANGTQNPVAALLQNNNTGFVFRQYGNLKFDYKFHFLPELKAVVNLGYDKTKATTNNLTPGNVPHQSNAIFVGNDSDGSQERKNTLLDGYLNYKKEFNHFKTDITAGYSYQKFENFGSNSGNRKNPNNFSTTFADPNVVLIGFFTRANFSFLDKYLLTLNYRRDGTSRFSSSNRWGNFPGAAVAWNISDEDFLNDSSIISNLKLRASYGITGQQDVAQRDIFLERYRFGNQNSQYLFGGVPIKSTIPSEINPDLKWEETATIEFGIDYGLFNNKISGSLGVFQKNSTDLLFEAAVADGSNFTNRIIQNIGELEIKGIEFSANVDAINTEDFKWDFNFNATFLDREITELALNQDVTTGGIAGGTGNYIQLFREGYAPNSFYVFKQLYDSAGKPIEGAYLDANGDNVINDDDRYLKGSPDADVILGFQSSFSYKKFDLAFNLRANIGNYAYNNVNSNRAQYALLQDQSVLGNIVTSVSNTGFQNTSDVIISDLYIENASFLKMDNITLGYTFDKPFSDFSKSSIRIWTGVQNVFTWTNYSGLDPEVFNGIDNLIYPRARTILFGANIKF